MDRATAVMVAVTVIVSWAASVPAEGAVVCGPMPAVAADEAGSRGGAGGAQEEEPQQEERQRYEEVVVVTASRTEQLLLEAPTAVTVISASTIATSPAQNYADLLRSVPGLNVSQMGARDVNLTSRAATGTLATSQLVLVDGRTVYQDFFGFVLWDLLPVDLAEIDQIEVIRGPSSAVWGANAMTGVVNVRTKSPRTLGNTTMLRVGGGERGTGYGTFLNAGVYDPWSYKFSASFYTQDPWPRPQTLPTGQPANIFPNEGTNQPKFDARVDRQLDPQSFLSFSGGIAATSGIVHTGIGPFTIKEGTNFWYLRGDYSRRAMGLRFYANILDGTATNLLNGLLFEFETQTYDISGQNTSFFADGTHILTYGANLRLQNFDLSIAPRGDDRQEGGGFIEDTITIGKHVLVNLGTRVDGFSVLDDAVVSPRVGAQFRPVADGPHSFRVSFSRAYRAPSLVNNFLDTVIFNQINLGAIVGIPFLGRFVFPSFAVGNEDLVEERLDQVEVGYRGVWADRVAIDAAYYWTRTEDGIDFFPARFYSPFDPPPGWPLPRLLLALIPLPKTFTYRNIGRIDNQGFELGLQAQVNPRNEFWVNYSWQDEPDPEGIALREINIPPAHRFNIGFNGFHGGWLYSVSVNYVDDAVWTDVLDARFHGPTEAFATLNGSVGYTFLDGRAEVSVRATNITDEEFQQHVFGDIIGRRVVAAFGFTLR